MGKISNGITQATASTEGVISAEGNIGKNKASGSIDSEGIWDLGIDFKVGGLGVTNDYGGAITITIADQSITWGREGGKIHYDLGGFEVIVEARDCVVTETKLIMGIEVASHTYPDPGCKLPDPKEEPEPPEPPPLPGGSEIEIPNTDALMWVICDETQERYSGTHGEVRFEGGTLSTRIATEIEVPVSSSRTPFGVTETSNSSLDTIHKIPKNRSSRFRNRIITLKDRTSAAGLFVLSDVLSGHGGATYQPTIRSDGTNYGRDLCFFGTGKEFNKLKDYADRLKQQIQEELVFYSIDGFRSATAVTIRPTQYIPLIPTQKKPQPFLRPGVPPHMKNDCCEELLESIDDLKEVLHVDFLVVLHSQD